MGTDVERHDYRLEVGSGVHGRRANGRRNSSACSARIRKWPQEAVNLVDEGSPGSLNNTIVSIGALKEVGLMSSDLWKRYAIIAALFPFVFQLEPPQIRNLLDELITVAEDFCGSEAEGPV